MGYPVHFLATFGGTRGTGTGEIWSCGIRMWAASYAGFDENAYLGGVMKTALQEWFLRPGSKIAESAKLAWCKLNAINEDGEYAEDRTNEFIYPSAISGGSTSPVNMPYQAAVALSWRTNVKDRGIGSHGRIYSPAPSITTNPLNGLFPAADALAMATSAALLINTLDITLGSDPFRPCIVSRGRKSGESYGPGEANQIDWVHVDNRVDTQRRRANQLLPVTSAVEVLY